MRLDSKKAIVIRQVLMGSGNTPAFVEFYSPSSSRNHIINASRFSEIFGYSMDELRKIAGDPNE